MPQTQVIHRYSTQEHDLLSEDSLNKNYVLRFRDRAEDEDLQEKLIKNGPESLSAGELLAVLLTTGTKKEEVLPMTSRILKEYGEKPIINQRNPKTIQKELDIPLAKACQIVACFELGKRFFKKDENGPKIVRTAKEAFEYLKEMGKLQKEHLRGLYLNSHFQIIHDEVISVGSLTANIIHPREVFRPAVEYSAAAIILAHNHPSGSPKPTNADLEITLQLVSAGRILGIDILDHLIITKKEFTSIIENNQISK